MLVVAAAVARAPGPYLPARVAPIQSLYFLTLVYTPAAGSREQGAGSRVQGAGSREQGAGSREQGVESREQGTGSEY